MTRQEPIMGSMAMPREKANMLKKRATGPRSRKKKSRPKEKVEARKSRMERTGASRKASSSEANMRERTPWRGFNWRQCSEMSSNSDSTLRR
jgi:hypothetical protein